ncbi:RNA binding motif protein 12Ba [Megalops cyprinoides]|uniref:RNA binding motif protein 12Ba n=1 Tax=Megalops cyprinoides TaxID=118141 RepID=UPI001863C5DF|nr:RNA binding motif protein 12Ba [Megalops cyprinoides]
MVVLRLQGLSIEAGSEDIRRFFDGLHIPNGGVHIIGGSLGEAFIIFATEKDAQLALKRSGSLLRGSRVVLFMSSKTELQNKMASSLKQYKYPEKGPERKPEEIVKACTSDPAAAFLLGLVSAIRELHAEQEGSKAISPANSVQKTSDYIAIPMEQQKQRATSSQNSRYLRLHGLPKSVTKHEVRQFFRGLEVQDVIVDVRIGGHYGTLVKFTREQDALKGLKYDGQNMAFNCVKVREASEDIWLSAVEECRKSLNGRQRNVSPGLKRMRPEDRSRSRSPKRHLPHSLSPSNDLCVMLQNIPPKTTKTQIKELFGCSYLPSNRVLHLLDEVGHRTSTAFIEFDQVDDYYSAMKLNGCKFGSRFINVSGITKEKMRAMIRASKYVPPIDIEGAINEQPSYEKTRERSYSSQTYIYVRNLPADVRKVEVKDFFCKFPVSQDHITLLCDRQGMGIGEALVRFASEDIAKMAESLHGQNFLGTRVLLTRITRQQMEDLLHKTH